MKITLLALIPRRLLNRPGQRAAVSEPPEKLAEIQ